MALGALQSRAPQSSIRQSSRRTSSGVLFVSKPLELPGAAAVPCASLVSLLRGSPQTAPSSSHAALIATRGMSVAARSAVISMAPSHQVFEPEKLPTVSLAPELVDTPTDLLLLAVTEDALKTEGEVTTIASEALAALDAKYGGVVADALAVGGFDGKPGAQSKILRVGGGAGPKYLGLVGLGKKDKLSTVPEWGVSSFQSLGNGLALLAKGNRSESVRLAFLDAPAVDATALYQVALGTLLGGYESTRFKTKTPPTASKLAALEVVLPGVDAVAATEAIAKAEAVARGTYLTRYLVEAPPNVCTPSHMAAAAQHVAGIDPSVMSVEVFDKEQCQEMGMGCYIGVHDASDIPLAFIHLKYSPPGGASKKIAIVGKGVTFDSGGYNIKAGAGSMIELMKFDMGGGGATIGAARIIASLKPKDVEVHFIVPACENMVAGKGMRPGDILRAANGKTVEINNTDAEGRLTLIDGIWFAQEKCGATTVVDIATLTGAIIVALGTEIAGLFTTSEPMASSLTAAAKTAGEKLWRMPMDPSYFETHKSAVADMRNTGGRSGGSISAALFIKQFVNEGVEWAHLDIAGPVWNEKASLPTGYGAALLAEWAAAQAPAPAAEPPSSS